MKKIEIARALAAARSNPAGDAGHDGAEPGADTSDCAALTRLPGLGRTRARRLHEALGITTLEELAAALLDGRVQALAGFGAEACERLRSELRQHFAQSHCVTLAEAEARSAPLIHYLRSLPAVERVEVAGSVRRRCPIVGDVDLLVVSARPTQVMRQLAAFPDAQRTEGMDGSRGSLVLHCGLRIDIRVVPRRCYGATLQFLTGSPAHNIAIRQLGLDRGFRVSEYGIFSVDQSRAGARRMGGQREEDIFEVLGLDWIPPELREDRGELRLAQQRALPRLVEPADLLGDLHLACRGSADAATLETTLAPLARAGYAYCAIVRPARPADGRAATATMAPGAVVGGMRVLHGVIAGIAPDGSLEAADDELESADVVFVEVRAQPRLSRTRMTDRLVRAMANPLVDVLAWPPCRGAAGRDDFDVDLDAVLAASLEHGVALELNAAGAPAPGCDAQVLRHAAGLGISFVLGSGARSPEGMSDIRYATDRARRGWIEARHVINARQPADLEQWLCRRATHREGVLAGAGF